MSHELPPLPYDYNALEPYIDEQTMRLHHDKHHQGYVNGLNNAEAKLAEARASGDYALVAHWERALAFHGSGHFLHTIYWANMAPAGNGGGGEPSGALAKQIDKDFGSFAAFKAQFSAATAAVEGSGWGILAWQTGSDQLVILQAEKHQNLTQQGAVPLLVLDVWEHAYYLKYQNRRGEYIDAWWNVVNWADAAERFAEARG
jgi:Fe-Mn family superoxide dismutase